jgi:hypothetical protein
MAAKVWLLRRSLVKLRLVISSLSTSEPIRQRPVGPLDVVFGFDGSRCPSKVNPGAISTPFRVHRLNGTEPSGIERKKSRSRFAMAFPGEAAVLPNSRGLTGSEVFSLGGAGT